MGIFSFFKKRKPLPYKASEPSGSPSAILHQILKEIPEFYENSKQYDDCKVFLEHQEYGLALESLIEMADESGHYFYEDFWLDLATCADKMGMSDEAAHCRKQLKRNEKAIGYKTSRGITWYEAADGMLKQHFVTKQHREWANEQRKKDKLDKLIKKDGFHMKSQGRCGTIYYIEHGKVLEIGWEMSGVPEYHILQGFDSINYWSIPEGLPLDPEAKATIRLKFQAWSQKEKLKTDLPPTPPEW